MRRIKSFVWDLKMLRNTDFVNFCKVQKLWHVSSSPLSLIRLLVTL